LRAICRSGRQDCCGSDLALDPAEHRRHAAHAEGRDGAGEAQQLRHVVRDGQDFGGAETVESFMQDTGEAPGGGGLGRRLEEETHALRRAAVVLFRLDGEKQRRLALDHLLHHLRVFHEPVRQLRKPPRELKQQLQPFRFGQGLEVVNNFRQGGGEGRSIHHSQLTHGGRLCPGRPEHGISGQTEPCRDRRL
jgi:hypothetical protein